MEMESLPIGQFVMRIGLQDGWFSTITVISRHKEIILYSLFTELILHFSLKSYGSELNYLSTTKENLIFAPIYSMELSPNWFNFEYI